MRRKDLWLEVCLYRQNIAWKATVARYGQHKIQIFVDCGFSLGGTGKGVVQCVDA